MTLKEELIEAIARSPDEIVQILLQVFRSLEHQQFQQASKSTQPERPHREQGASGALQTRIQWLDRLRQFRTAQPPLEPLSATIIKARQEERY